MENRKGAAVSNGLSNINYIDLLEGNQHEEKEGEVEETQVKGDEKTGDNTEQDDSSEERERETREDTEQDDCPEERVENETDIEQSQRILPKPRRKAKEIEEEHRRKRQQQEERLLEQGVRRSERIKNKREQANIAVSELIPKNLQEELQSSEADRWEGAMKEELDCMGKREVWRLVPRRPETKVIKSKWIYNCNECKSGENAGSAGRQGSLATNE